MKRHPFQHTLDRTSIHWQAYIGIRKNSGMGMGVGYIPIPEPVPEPPEKVEYKPEPIPEIPEFSRVYTRHPTHTRVLF